MNIDIFRRKDGTIASLIISGFNFEDVLGEEQLLENV